MGGVKWYCFAIFIIPCLMVYYMTYVLILLGDAQKVYVDAF